MQWASQGLCSYSEADLITYLYANSTPAWDWPTYLLGCPSDVFPFMKHVTVSVTRPLQLRFVPPSASASSVLPSTGRQLHSHLCCCEESAGATTENSVCNNNPSDEWKVMTKSRNTKWDAAHLSRAHSRRTQENSRRKTRWKGGELGVESNIRKARKNKRMAFILRQKVWTSSTLGMTELRDTRHRTETLEEKRKTKDGGESNFLVLFLLWFIGVISEITPRHFLLLSW